jgi:hypothetical protein
MTSVSMKIALPYPVIFVADPEGGEVPKDIGDSLITATTSCVAVGCYPDVDGPTELTLGPLKSVDPGRVPDFSGKLQTPSHKLAIHSAEDKLLEVPVHRGVTTVSIWVNHATSPDRVWVGFS